MWQMDPQTGELWRVRPDTEMSEAEVEKQVGEAREAREAVESLSAARDLVRAEVR